jgi:hypothetical protein
LSISSSISPKDSISARKKAAVAIKNPEFWARPKSGNYALLSDVLFIPSVRCRAVRNRDKSAVPLLFAGSVLRPGSVAH